MEIYKRDSIVDKIYVINLDERSDRWKNINIDFLDTGLELNRWPAIYGKKMSDEMVKRNTTNLCNIFCSPSMVGIWLSHYKLWEHIVKNGETNVLILEDDAVPIKDFNNKLVALWDQVPKDWDMLFLGCHGSCDMDSVYNELLSTLHGRHNSNVYIKNKLSKNIIRPSFPLGFYAYMLSYKGAKKLVNNPYLKKARYHIDYAVSKEIFKDNSFRVYATIPPLIYPEFDTDYSDNMDKNHQSLKNMTFLNTQALYYRPAGLPITLFSLILFVLSFLIGLFGSVALQRGFIFILFGLQAVDITASKFKKDTVRALLFELIFSIFLIAVGSRIQNYILKG